MKRIHFTIIIMVCSLSFINSAHAQRNAVNGIIIGGGAGAIVGQAIGRNTESTIIGATVGSVLGLIVSSDVHQRRYPNVRHHSQVIYKPIKRHHSYHPGYRGNHKRYYNKRQHHNKKASGHRRPHWKKGRTNSYYGQHRY